MFTWLRRLPPPASPIPPRRSSRPQLEPLEDRLTPAVHEWTGLGANNLWSNPQNWTNGSPAADLSGDVDLVFHTNLTTPANLATQNDLVGLVVDSITFDANAGTVGPTTFATGGTSTAGYTVSGNAITVDTGGPGQDPFAIDVANNVTSGAGVTHTFNAGLTLLNTNATVRSQQTGARLTFTGAIDLGTRTLTVDVAGISNPATQGVTISGAVSNGDLIKAGGGTLELSGNNSYANTTVSNGNVVVTSDTGLGAAAGVVTANDPGRVELRNGVTVVKTVFNLNANNLGGGLGADGNTTNTFRGNVVLFAGAGGVALGAGLGTANANTRLVIDGVISGATSTLSLNGAGVIQFTRNNTYTGLTNHNGNNGFGALQIDAPGGLGAGGAGNETQLNRNGAGPTGSALWLNFNGTLQDGGGIGENIQYAGSGVNNTGAVRTLGNSNVILPGSVVFTAGAPWFFGVDGASGSLTTTGVISSQGATRALTKVGAGTMVVGGAVNNTLVGNTVVNGGTVRVTNTSGQPLGVVGNTAIVNATGTLQIDAGVAVPNAVTVNAGGTLAGGGTVNNTVTSVGGTISPGASPGLLTVNGNVTLNAASAFRVELNGTTAGTQYDQLAVNGIVTLGGAALTGLRGFVPAVGNTFVLIDNDGADAVVGTFAGLAEGATVQIGGFRFTVSYVGGSGNDVVLTAVGPAAPLVTPTSGLTTTEGGGTAQFTVVLQSQPSANVTLSVTSSNPAEGTVSVSTLTFTPANWNVPQAVTITGVDDPAVDGNTPYTIVLGPIVSTDLTYNGIDPADVSVTNLDNDTLPPPPPPPPPPVQNRFATSIGSVVRVFDPSSNSSSDITPFPGFTGGVRVATADVNGDGRLDVIVAAGAGGGPHVKVFDGVTLTETASFYAFDPGFTGGVYVAAAKGRIVVGAGAGGGPHVKMIDATKLGQVLPNGRIADTALTASFFAYDPSFTGGVRVATADTNNDLVLDVVTGAGPGGGPHVKSIDGRHLGQVLSNGQIADAALIGSVFAFEQSFAGGVFVAAAVGKIAVGADVGGGTQVRMSAAAGIEENRILAYDPAFAGGVRVGFGDVNADGVPDLLTAAGPGGGPHVKAFLSFFPFTELKSFFAGDPLDPSGVFVG